MHRNLSPLQPPPISISPLEHNPTYPNIRILKNRQLYPISHQAINKRKSEICVCVYQRPYSKHRRQHRKMTSAMPFPALPKAVMGLEVSSWNGLDGE